MVKISFHDFSMNGFCRNSNDQGKASLDFRHRAIQDQVIFKSNQNENVTISKITLNEDPFEIIVKNEQCKSGVPIKCKFNSEIFNSIKSKTYISSWHVKALFLSLRLKNHKNSSFGKATLSSESGFPTVAEPEKMNLMKSFNYFPHFWNWKYH